LILRSLASTSFVYSMLLKCQEWSIRFFAFPSLFIFACFLCSLTFIPCYVHSHILFSFRIVSILYCCRLLHRLLDPQGRFGTGRVPLPAAGVVVEPSVEQLERFERFQTFQGRPKKSPSLSFFISLQIKSTTFLDPNLNHFDLYFQRISSKQGHGQQVP